MSGAISFGEWSWTASTSLVRDVVSAALGEAGIPASHAAWKPEDQYFFATRLDARDRELFVDAFLSLGLAERVGPLATNGRSQVSRLQHVMRDVSRWARAEDSTVVSVRLLEPTDFDSFAQLIDDGRLHRSGVSDRNQPSETHVSLSMKDLRSLDSEVSEASVGSSNALFEPGPRIYEPAAPAGMEGIRLAREFRRRREAELPEAGAYFSRRSALGETSSDYEHLDVRWSYVKDLDLEQVVRLRPLLSQQSKALAISLS